jgi:hypothetical protein
MHGARGGAPEGAAQGSVADGAVPRLAPARAATTSTHKQARPRAVAKMNW